MSKTCSGKSCEECIHKDSLECNEHKVDTQNSLSSEYELAKSCKGEELGIEGEDKKKVTKEKALFLGKWLWILFWLFIPLTLTNLMTNKTIVEWFPSLNLIGNILSTIFSVIYGLVLIKLSSENKHYRTSGICWLFVSVLSLVVLSILDDSDNAILILSLSLPILVVSLVSEYYEYIGHAGVLSSIYTELSEKWISLWKWYIKVLIALFVGLIITLIVPILGLLIILTTTIMIFIVSITKLVYIYRMAKFFRNAHKLK